MKKIKTDKTWTLFLDRDGVINQRNFSGYVKSVEEFHFLPFVLEGLKRLHSQFSQLFIVSNQQGVGKGIMRESQLKEIDKYMIEEFQKYGIPIPKIYYATNLKGAEKDKRKPLKALGLQAKKDFPSIEFAKSIMVGDTDSDIAFGMNLGMKTVLVVSPEKTTLQPDLVVNNLKELAHELA